MSATALCVWWKSRGEQKSGVVLVLGGKGPSSTLRGRRRVHQQPPLNGARHRLLLPASTKPSSLSSAVAWNLPASQAIVACFYYFFLVCIRWAKSVGRRLRFKNDRDGEDNTAVHINTLFSPFHLLSARACRLYILRGAWERGLGGGPTGDGRFDVVSPTKGLLYSTSAARGSLWPCRTKLRLMRPISDSTPPESASWSCMAGPAGLVAHHSSIDRSHRPVAVWPAPRADTPAMALGLRRTKS